MLCEEGLQTLVLRKHLVRHHLVRILVVVAEVREIGHDSLRIGVVATGGNGLAEGLADTGTVARLVGQIFTGLAVENIGRTALRMVAEILVAQIVDQHQRVDIHVLLVKRFGAVDLVLVKRNSTHEGILRGLRALIQQLFQIVGGGIVVLVVARLLEEVAVQNVLLTLLGRITPDRVLRITEILSQRREREERACSGEQEFYVFHWSE